MGQLVLDLVLQYGAAGRRLTLGVRKALGGIPIVWEAWEHVRNAQRFVRYFHESPRVPEGVVVLLGASSVVRFPLEELFPGAPVVGRGLGAESVEDTMRRLRWTMPEARPSGVIVWAGANDLRAFALDPLLIVERVARLLDAIRGRYPGVPLALISIPPWCDQTATDLDRLRRLNDGLRSLAFARGLAFVDTCRPPIIDAAGDLVPEMADADRKHLGAAGYAHLARWLCEEGGEAAAALCRGAPPAGLDVP